VNDEALSRKILKSAARRVQGDEIERRPVRRPLKAGGRKSS
jgi:hypothetical protein